jgi:hypothetical protein
VTDHTASLRASTVRDLVLRHRLKDVLVFGLLGFLPAVWIVGVIATLLTVDLDTKAAFDLKVAFLPAAHAVLHGASPYPGLHDAALANQEAYVYPPFVAFLTTPMTIVPVAVASVIGVIGSLLVVPLIVFLAGIRDWRCYSVALCWSPVFNGAQNVNVSIPIALLIAIAWRFRRSWLVSGLSIGCAVAAKVFVWPLLVWPLTAMRRRAAVVGFSTAIVLAFGSWAAIGFKGFKSYPDLIRTLTAFEETQSYSLSGALRVLGSPQLPARIAAFVVTLLLCGLALHFGRRSDHERSLSAAVVAALASTPILWQHYLVLLLVPVAVCRPRLSAVWFVPWLLWLSPFTGNGTLVQTLLVPAAVVAVGFTCLWSPRRPIPFRRLAASAA